MLSGQSDWFVKELVVQKGSKRIDNQLIKSGTKHILTLNLF